MTPLRAELRQAVSLALAGDWQAAHAIVQKHEDDPTACWIHAVVHRIEGDSSNARYWYRRSRHEPGPAQTPEQELVEIRRVLVSGGGSRKRSGTRTGGTRARR
jgi:hypothetical protein